MPVSSVNSPCHSRFFSWMATLDIRVKVVTLCVLSLSLAFMKNPVALTFLGALSSLCLLSLRRFRLTLLVYVLLLVTWLLSFGFGLLLEKLLPAMQGQTATQALIPFLRLWPLANMTLAVAFSMRIGNALTTLKKMRLPRIVYLPVMVALRFIPGFFNDIKQLRDCLKLRGISVTTSSLLLHPQRTLRLLIVPMVIRALRLADELAIAAELKQVGYGAGPRTVKTPLRRGDVAFALGAALTLVVAWHLPGTDIPSAMSNAIHASHPDTETKQPL